jgi:hypothetical protein
VSSRSRRTRARNARSTPVLSGIGASSGSAPESCAGVSAEESSSRASGFPPRLDDQPITDLRRKRDARAAIDQFSGSDVMQPTEPKRRETRRLEAARLALTGGTEHDDPFYLKPPGDEDERLLADASSSQ